MKLKLVLFFLTIGYTAAWAQLFEKQDLISFNTRLDNPVTVEVIRTRDVLSFYGVNKSFYPYRLELQFNSFGNLSPFMVRKDAILYSGRSLLFKLTITDPTRPPDYGFSIRYTMGNPDERADENFTYLFPVAKGRMVEKFTVVSSNTSYIYKDAFRFQKGDTVYAIRKGVVTSRPDAERVVDRIMTNTLEVRHDDGTVAVYTNVDPDLPLVKYGQKVYPGQPIGIADELDFVRVNVFRFSEDNKIQPMEIKYAVTESKSVIFSEIDEILVDHPRVIIETELTDREIKRLRKGNLYAIVKEE